MARSICRPIPRHEVEAFLRGLPVRHPFPDHPDARVRSITLADLYRATLEGLDFLVRFLGTAGINDHLLAICLDLETSLHPFLAANRHVRANIRRLAGALLAELADVPAATHPDSWDLYSIGSLRCAERHLTGVHRGRLRGILEAVARHLRGRAAPRPMPADPLGDGSEEAWEGWLHQVVEARYAHDLGAAVDLEAFYARTVERLLAVPFAESYALELVNVMTHAAYGLSAYNRIPLRDHALANRLADHGLACLRWLRTEGLYTDDPEILAAFLDAFLKGTSRAYGSTPEFGSIVRFLLDTQGADGAWRPNESEDGDPYPLYHPTWVCVDALRPLANDLLHPDNRRLGLL